MDPTISEAILGVLSIAGLALVFSLWRRARRLHRDIRYMQDHVWNSVALLQACAFRSPPPPAEEWAASSDLLCELFRIVRQDRPKVVVELGCGLSTLVIASALARNGSGRLIAIEDQAAHASTTRRHLVANDLDALVEIRLVPIARSGTGVDWYETSGMDDLDGIDVLFIDGPGLAGEDVRRPSLPFFWDRMSSGAIAILDDAARPEERAIARAWQEGWPNAEFQYVPLRKGALMIRKPD